MSSTRIREALRQHWPHHVICDHEAKKDAVACSCALWIGTPQPSVGQAIEKWIDHVFEEAGELGDGEPSPSFQKRARDMAGVPDCAEATPNSFKSVRELQGYKKCHKCGTEWLGEIENCPNCANGEPSLPPKSGHWFVTQRVVKKAIQWNGNNEYEIAEFLPAEKFNISDSGAKLFIETLEGCMEANVLDWIIRGVNGEFYPCKPEIFAKTYEPFESGAAQEVSPPSPEMFWPPLNEQEGHLYEIRHGKTKEYVMEHVKELLAGDTRELKAALTNLVARLKIVMAWPEPHFSQDLPIEIRAELAEAEKLLG